MPQHADVSSSCWGWYCSESLWFTMVVIDDAPNPYELLWLLDMILASWWCWPQLLHPYAEDDTARVEDEHPLHPLQRMSLCASTCQSIRCALDPACDRFMRASEHCPGRNEYFPPSTAQFVARMPPATWMRWNKKAYCWPTQLLLHILLLPADHARNIRINTHNLNMEACIVAFAVFKHLMWLSNRWGLVTWDRYLPPTHKQATQVCECHFVESCS
jgi:hypothetical protein